MPLAQWTTSEWAAWAQAVGSIAAVGGGIWAVNHQHNLQRRSDRRDEIERDLDILRHLRAIALAPTPLLWEVLQRRNDLDQLRGFFRSNPLPAVDHHTQSVEMWSDVIRARPQLALPFLQIQQAIVEGRQAAFELWQIAEHRDPEKMKHLQLWQDKIDAAMRKIAQAKTSLEEMEKSRVRDLERLA